MKDLNAKICLITGAASGIGRATALLVAGKGARLVLTDLDVEGLDKVVAEAEGVGAEVVHAAAFDISDADAVAAFATDVHQKVRSVDVIMNIAGTSIWGSIENLQREHWQQMVDINLMGPISVMSEFVPPMIEADRGGHIVNVSSAAGLFGLPWHAAYSASKFGLRGVSEVLRFDLAPHKIGVTVVCPGAVKTPLVGTMRIVGVDQDAPAVKQAQGRFERHAITPEKAAECIVRGIERNKYLVLTSPDITIGHLAQRVFPWGYRFAMTRLNRELMAVARKAKTNETA